LLVEGGPAVGLPGGRSVRHAEHDARVEVRGGERVEGGNGEAREVGMELVDDRRVDAGKKHGRWLLERAAGCEGVGQGLEAADPVVEPVKED